MNMIFDNAFSSDNLMKIINSIEEGIGETTVFEEIQK